MPQSSPERLVDQPQFGTGCLACGEDDDHANLLLCENCNAEYHTYCLSPPLRSVPTCDWFCTQCIQVSTNSDDLANLINALDPFFTERFGEICWAQGGAGFGWWPAFIYDPRQTVGSARELARKHLGRRHLVYFFECHDAPFACLVDSKITKWEDGLMDDFHLGRAAKSSGKNRIHMFQQALQAATVEGGKPVECRMAFNHSDQPQVIPSHPELNPSPKTRSIERYQEASDIADRTSVNENKGPHPRGFPLRPHVTRSNQVACRRALKRSFDSLYDATEDVNDPDFYCKILVRAQGSSSSTSLGFIRLTSPLQTSLADARKIIQTDLSCDFAWLQRDWRFYIPRLGIVSKKQEVGLGPLLPLMMLHEAITHSLCGTRKLICLTLTELSRETIM